MLKVKSRRHKTELTPKAATLVANRRGFGGGRRWFGSGGVFFGLAGTRNDGHDRPKTRLPHQNRPLPAAPPNHDRRDKVITQLNRPATNKTKGGGDQNTPKPQK